MSKKKERIVTAAMILFEGKKILNERPEGMPFKVYKAQLRQQSTMLNVLHTQQPDRRIAKMMPTRIGYNVHPLVKAKKDDKS